MLPSYVGQVENLRPIVHRPGARPGKLLGCRRQFRSNWIHLDLVRDPPKLSFIAHNAIVAFVLPERVTGEPQYSISLSGGESLERLHQLGNLDARGDQQMDMISHDHVAMEGVVREVVLSIKDGLNDHFRDLRLAKMQRACASIVEKAVHNYKSSTVSSGGWEHASRWKAAVQSPG